MKLVISPAKNIDFESYFKTNIKSYLKFDKEANTLVSILKKYAPSKLASLMKISDKLADLNFARYQNWEFPFTDENAKPAVGIFNGDVYRGLDVETFDENDLQFMQNHLRILSGLYGILKPTDLIQAYRLEMGTKLKNNEGKNLYEFWGDKITEFLNEELKVEQNPILINLASIEYFKVINQSKLKALIITPQFKELRNGKLKIISFSAKRARGLMSRYIIKNKIENIEEIKAFNLENYQYDDNLSDSQNFIFTR